MCMCPGDAWSVLAGYVSLASQNPYPIIVYSVANYRPYLGQFWPQIFLNSCLPEFSYPIDPENVQPPLLKM